MTFRGHLLIVTSYRMIRLCNLLYKKSAICSTANTSFGASRYKAPMTIQWRSCKVCCAKKHPVQCNILKYLQRTKKLLRVRILKNGCRFGYKIGQVYTASLFLWFSIFSDDGFGCKIGQIYLPLYTIALETGRNLKCH